VFRDRLRDAMLVRGLSASELGRRVGVPRQTVAKWLRMKTAELSGVHLAKVADVLNVRMHWLATGVGKLMPLNTRRPTPTA